jgi:hypothetical protein
MTETRLLTLNEELEAWVDQLTALATTADLLLSALEPQKDEQFAQLQDLDLAVSRASWLFQALRSQLAEDLLYRYHFSRAVLPSKLMQRPLVDEPAMRERLHLQGPMNALADLIEAWPLQLQRWHDELPVRDTRFASILLLRLGSFTTDIDDGLGRLADAVRHSAVSQAGASEPTFHRGCRTPPSARGGDR